MRREDWPERLADYLDARREMRFAWVDNDCCSFAAGALEAMTGERPTLPEYGSAADGARLLADRPISARVDDLYGPQITPAMAQRGDLMLMVFDGRETLGICVGDYIAAPGTERMVMVPVGAAVCAWKVA